MITFPLNGRIPVVKWGQLEEAVYVPDGYNTGIVTGRKSGIIVLDVDMKDGKNGLASLEKLGALPDTYAVQTPTGGYHFYFTHPDFHVPNSASTLGVGLDIRGDGGMVMAPPSPGYTVFNDVPTVAAPEWLLTWLKTRKVEAATVADYVPFTEAELEPHKEAIAKLVSEYPPAIEGQGGSNVFFKLCLELTKRYRLPFEIATEAIEEFYNPRCIPPWSDAEIQHKLESAARSSIDLPLAPAWFDKYAAKAQANPEVQALIAETNAGYTFTPGVDRASGEKAAKISLGDATFMLVNDPAWRGVLRYDSFRQALIAVNPPMRLNAETTGLSDTDITAVRTWFECQGAAIGKEDCYAAIRSASLVDSFHPVRDYLDSLPEANTTYLDDAATRLFGAETEIENVMFRKTLIAAVRRIYEPGAKIDTILVLQGQQGKRKSSFVESLFTPWYRDQMPELSGRDASHALEGYWGIELAELDKLNKLENSTVKDFLSRRADKYRQFGNGEKVEYKRQCVFIGTTNDDAFLRDATGNRRFWIVEVKRDIPNLTPEIRTNLWATAKALHLAGERHWLDEAEEAQAEAGREGFQDVDPWVETVKKEIGRLKAEHFTPDDILGKIIPTADKQDYKARNRICRILKRMGIRQTATREGTGKLHRVWVTPSKD